MNNDTNALILAGNHTLGVHIEHFDPTTRTWTRCKSTMNNPCPFKMTPHKESFDGDEFCDCGKTMIEVMDEYNKTSIKVNNKQELFLIVRCMHCQTSINIHKDLYSSMSDMVIARDEIKCCKDGEWQWVLPEGLPLGV